MVEETTIPPESGYRRDLSLLGHFHLTGTPRSTLGSAGQRLVALLAIHGGVMVRWQVAQLLYPHGDDVQAAANLRATLWRLQRCCPDVLAANSAEIRLMVGLEVDYWTAMRTARKLLGRSDACDADEMTLAMTANLRDDLLPGWPESWLIAERESFHQLRLHALEALCAKLTANGWYGAAVDAGLAAVRGDPLRESAHRALIDAYLAEGNTCEALRQFDNFRSLLQADLGLCPSGALQRKVASAIDVRSFNPS